MEPKHYANVQGYRFIGTDISNLDQSIDVASSTTTAVISDLTNGETYYFAVVAFNDESETAQAATLFCYSKPINYSSSLFNELDST